MRRATRFGMLAACLWLAATGGNAFGASYAELLAKAKASVGFAAEAGKQRAEAPEPANAYAPSAADEAAGVVVYLPPMDEPFLGQRPTMEQVRQAVEVRAAPGESESFLVAVHALEAQRGLRWSTRSRPAAGIRVECLPLVMAPMARSRSDEYRITGLWLAEGGAVDLEAGECQAWLVRLHVADTARAGERTITLQLEGASGRLGPGGPTIRLNVLPIRLVDPWQRGYVFGAFCAGADFNEAQYRQMKEHGIEAILWFWGHYGLKVVNDNGRLRMDLSELDATVGRFMRAGLRGPIVLALGNDGTGHFERAICQAFNLPMQPQVERKGKVVNVAVLDDPRIEELMVEALRQLFDHAQQHHWPEIAILPYDEPTERLMDEHRRMVRLFRRHFPRIRLYGVTMDRLNWAEMVLDTDILVANGSWEAIGRLAQQHDKGAWFYNSITTANGYAQCRWRYGLRPYVYGPGGMWFWSYNFHPGDPWNEFDSHTPDSGWVICWPPVRKGEASVETLAYEGLREAADDVRYAMALEAALAKADGPVAEGIRTAYEEWRAGLKRASPEGPEIPRFREQLIEWLGQL